MAQQHRFQVFGFRWTNLGVYILVCFMAGAGQAALSPMFAIMAGRWHVSFGTAALTMIALTIFQVLMSIPAGMLSQKVGFKILVCVGSTLLALGYFMRGTADNLNGFVLWNLVAGVGWGLVWAPIGTLVANWFPHQEIGQANSYWPAGLSAGQALGSLTPLAFYASSKANWAATWRPYGWIAIVITILAWVVFKEKPNLPPEPRPPMKPVSIGEGLKQVLTPVTIPLQYTVLATVGSLAAGPALLAPLLMNVHKVAPAASGVISGLALVGAVIGSVFVPTLAFRSNKVRSYMLVCALLSPVFFLLQFLLPVTASNASLLSIPSFLFGFVTAPVMGMAMGFGQAQPYVTPLNAGTLAGIYLTSIGIGASAILQIVGQVVDATHGNYAAGAWMEAALLVVSLAVIFLTVKDAPRHVGPPPGSETPGHL